MSRAWCVSLGHPPGHHRGGRAGTSWRLQNVYKTRWETVETNVRTPLDIFNLPQHLVIPLFQRPYVWDETDQWLPLWQDVRRLAELRLTDPYSSATHFLGAVVVQAQENQTGNLPARNVIDGQQRLTTLQLLMDAAGSVLEEQGLDALSGQLEMLTHNLGLSCLGLTRD